MERSGYPYGKKPWLRRDSCVGYQRTVIGDHLDVVVLVSVVVVGLAVMVLALLTQV